MKSHDFSFLLRTIVSDSGRRSVGRFTCCECEDILDIPYVGQKPPIFFVQKAAQRGWSAHESRRSKVYCPKCAKTQPTVSEKQEQDMTTPPVSLVKPRQPTADERLKIRGLLDKHFDDSNGEFLDGMDDDKIAEKADLPRVWVTTIREAAYGPIRVNPQIAELRKRLADVDAEVASIRAKLDLIASKDAAA